MYPFSKDPSLSDTMRASHVRPFSGASFTDSYDNDLETLFGDQQPQDDDFFHPFDLFTPMPSFQIPDPKRSSRSQLLDDTFSSEDASFISFISADYPSEYSFGALSDDAPAKGSPYDLLTLSDSSSSSLLSSFPDSPRHPFNATSSKNPLNNSSLFEPVSYPTVPASLCTPQKHNNPNKHSVSASSSSSPSSTPFSPSSSSPISFSSNNNNNNSTIHNNNKHQLLSSSPVNSLHNNTSSIVAAAPKRQRTASGAGSSATTTKMASRIFALQRMFSARAPPRKPDFLSEAQWRDLVSRPLLVEVVECQNGRVSVRMCSTFDVIVHSQANYGQALKEWTESPATRFRWWSDFSIGDIKVANRNVNKAGTEIERTVMLPQQLIGHPLIQAAWKRRDNAALLQEFSSFFSRLWNNYLHPDDHALYEDGGFGRTRKRPRSNDSTRALELTIDQTKAALDQSSLSTRF